MCIWWNNQQLFAYKTTLGPIMQIVKNRFVRFVSRSFKRVDFQRPYRVCRSFCFTLKFTGLVKITNIDIGGELLGLE